MAWELDLAGLRIWDLHVKPPCIIWKLWSHLEKIWRAIYKYTVWEICGKKWKWLVHDLPIPGMPKWIWHTPCVSTQRLDHCRTTPGGVNYGWRRDNKDGKIKYINNSLGWLMGPLWTIQETQETMDFIINYWSFLQIFPLTNTWNKIIEYPIIIYNY